MKTTERLAFDRASVRSFDGNGRLQVKSSHISKANVCPYFGREIPNAEQLGLDPDRIYRLWRHPDELKKAAPTFNNIPVLCIHTPDFPGDPPREYRVGTTHSGSEFNDPYLDNGLSVWDDSAIAGIETDEQKELSSSYQYVADMTPGVTPNGEPYDGIMRDIIGNHVALVEKGRAGSDVLVADSLPPELKQMARAKNILDALKPFLAADADLKEVEEKVKDKLDEEDEKREEDDLKKKADREKEEAEKLKKETADDEDDEDSDDKKKKPAEDEDDEDDKKDDKVSKTAMYSAIRLAADSATKRAAENFRKVREAEQDVRPLIGDVVAMDSADDVYRTALEQAGVDIEGVHPSAFPKMVKMAIEQQNNKRPVIAQDSASNSEFEKAFPTAGKLKRGF
ncbi:DNA primase [Salmonella enterica subsp. enterica]|nr:DNA primase [Salmonella enterica subsp. enterica]